MDKIIEKLKEERTPVVEKCLSKGFSGEDSKFIREEQCSKVTEDGYCESYAFPSIKWRIGRCPLSSNYDPYLTPVKGKKRVGQQKQAKKI